MKAPTDIPSLVADLTRPIVGIENRTAQEAFDIMADRFRHSLDALSPKEAELVKPPREYEVSGDAASWAEIANQAVKRNLIEGSPKYDSAQGYACAMDALRIAFGDRRTPAASHDAARERIARIIDPDAAEIRDKVINGVESWQQERGVHYEAWANRWAVRGKFNWERALTKADAILAALPTTDGACLRADIAKLYDLHGDARCDECFAPLFDSDETTTDEAETVALCAGHREAGQPIYAYRLATPPTTDASERMREACAKLAAEKFAGAADLPDAYRNAGLTIAADIRAMPLAALAPSNNEVSGDK